MGKTRTRIGLVAVAAAGALLLAACGGSSADPGTSGAPTAGPVAKKGGTIYYLTNADQFQTLDPQVSYTGEDLAFFNSTLFRTLNAYKFSPDAKEGTSVVPDMATDTGTASDGGKTWAWTLKDGLTFQDGSPIACKDVAYGVSRVFADDVIVGGPTYAIQFLDIPSDADGSSAYKGPYKKTGQALFDKAVACSADGKTITFHLKLAVPDFNYTVTLLAFSPVPAALDTGEKYSNAPVSSGPYMVKTYQTGKGGKLLLVRNPKWNQTSDDYRKALPDTWEVDFGLDTKVIDQRIIQSTGADSTAIGLSLEPESLPIVFVSPTEAQPQYTGRALSTLDPYVSYWAFNMVKMPNLKVRQAIAVALDRNALRKNAGGDYAGDFGDGVIKPNMGIDYAPTGLWDTLLGKPIPPTGDPDYAKQLITESGAGPVTFTFDYAQSPTGDKAAALIVSSLARAGITAKPNPIEPGQYYGIVFDPAKSHEMIKAGWGPDWPNASTIIPPLFTMNGGFDLSQYDDKAFNAEVLAASTEPDRAKQATMWQNLNKEAVAKMLVLPTIFGREQRMAGDKVSSIYIWPAYGSWPYAEMGVIS